MSIIVQIKVTPNASQNQILGLEEGILRLKIKGVPEKGQVNEEVIRFLAKELGIAKSQIEMISGHNSRLKRLRIEGVTEKEFKNLLNSLRWSKQDI